MMLDAAFSALSDPTRRSIVERLARGPRRVTELAEPFEMSLAAVSKHIQVLERAGLVKRTREGREHVLSLDARPMREVARYASKFEKFWTERLDLLEAFVVDVEKQKKEKK
jgi:DNA-binding transcriptional ArsR family regulator